MALRFIRLAKAVMLLFGITTIPFTQSAFAQTAALAEKNKIQNGENAMVEEPVLLLTLKDRWEEAWLGSPAVADLDMDGEQEIIVARANALIVWNADGSLSWKFNDTPGRIFASPVVADFRDDAQLEIAFGSGDQVFLLDAEGNVLSGFPVTWEGEIRSLAAGDVDGDGKLDLVAAPTTISSDVVNAWHADGSQADEENDYLRPALRDGSL